MFCYDSLTEEQNRLLTAVMDRACYVVPQLYRPDCCIAAARVLMDTFHSFGVAARPQCVLVNVMNPAFLALGGMEAFRNLIRPDDVARWRERGARLVTLGHPDSPRQPGKWPGHLVCLAWDRILLDLSLPQACRPEKDILLPCLSLEVGDTFLSGEQSWVVHVNGCDVSYETMRDDQTYKGAPDWWRRSRRQLAVDLIVRAVREDMKQW